MRDTDKLDSSEFGLPHAMIDEIHVPVTPSFRLKRQSTQACKTIVDRYIFGRNV
jgi:hypothetical protein